MSIDAAHGGRRVLAWCLLLVLALTSVSGCMRVRIAAAVDANDLVTGEVVAAEVVPSEDEPGRVLKPPPDLVDRVRAEPYRDGDYAGTRLLFSGLTFEEFGRLNQVEGGESERLRFELRRSGQLVVFTGSVDLTESPANNPSGVQIRISFPGRITATNGIQDEQTVSWEPAPNAVSELTATASYAEPGTRTWQEWAMAVGGLAGLVVLLIIVLALFAHRRFVRQAAEAG